MSFDVLSFLIGQQTGKESGGDPGGGETGGSYRYHQFLHRATAGQETISHGLDEVPDILVVMIDKTPTDYCIAFALGFSQAMLDKMGDDGQCIVRLVGSNSGAFGGYRKKGIEDDDENSNYAAVLGGIRSCNNSTFTIGSNSSTGKLQVDTDYLIIAVSGIV